MRIGPTRRQFLATATVAVAAPLLVPSTLLGRDRGISPSNRLNTMLIGYGNRGSEIIGGFVNNPNFQFLGVCDCNRPAAERGKARVDDWRKNTDCEIVPTYEEALKRSDVDVIVCSTPDHWHSKISIEACEAGKDVFCEKPLTLTLEEGQQIVLAARKYDRVCCSGSQRVMEDYGYMAPIIQTGVIGDVKEVFVGLSGPGVPCYLPEEPVPAGLDWDRWLGQAPWAPFNPDRMSGSYGGGWRRFEDYGGGFLADWGAHKFGGVMYALGLDHTLPVEILPKGVDGEYATMIFANGVKVRHGGGDITFVGTKGELRHGQRDVKPLKPVELRRYSGGARNILEDFAYSIRNRIRPFQDFLYGARVAGACQLLNICYKLNRPLKWDNEKYDFVGDPQASRMISRPQRSPYTIKKIEG